LPALPSTQSLVSSASKNIISAPLRETLDQLSGLYVAEALDRLRPDTASFTLAAFARHARVGRAQGPLLKRVLAIAESTGTVTRDGDEWTCTSAARESSQALWRRTFETHPAHQAELLLLAGAGESLAEQLSGAETAPHNDALLGQLGDTAPFAAPLNATVRSIMDALVDAWPAQRPLRILEVGGGHGGLTSQIAPLLPADRVDYLFTDEDEGLTARAEKRFAQHRFVRTATLAPTEDLIEQDIPAGYFDLVLVSATTGSAKDLTTLLEALPTAMADQGLLVVAGAHTGDAASLLFEQQLKIDAALLQTSGFENVAQVDSEQINVFVAQAPQRAAAPVAATAEEPSRYTIYAEATEGFAQKLVSELRTAGHTATCRDLSSLCPAQAPEQTQEEAQQDRTDLAPPALVAELKDDRPDHMVFLSARQADAAKANTQTAEVSVVVGRDRAIEVP